MKFVLAMLVTALSLAGQTVSGTLEGRVLDASGAAIVNAKVSIKGIETGLIRNTTSNDGGYYQMTFVPLSTYTVTAESPGFASAQRNALVELNAARVVEIGRASCRERV